MTDFIWTHVVFTKWSHVGWAGAVATQNKPKISNNFQIAQVLPNFAKLQCVPSSQFSFN